MRLKDSLCAPFWLHCDLSGLDKYTGDMLHPFEDSRVERSKGCNSNPTAPMKGGESLEELGALFYLMHLLARIALVLRDARDEKRARHGKHAR